MLYFGYIVCRYLCCIEFGLILCCFSIEYFIFIFHYIINIFVYGKVNFLYYLQIVSGVSIINSTQTFR